MSERCTDTNERLNHRSLRRRFARVLFFPARVFVLPPPTHPSERRRARRIVADSRERSELLVRVILHQTTE